MAIGIALTVLPDTQEQALKVVEVLSRAATGLVFDNLTCTISFTVYEMDEEES